MNSPTCPKCDCVKGCSANPVPCPNLTHEVTTQAEPACSDHPDAPHGFMRNESHSAHRYVCECEGWEPSVITPPWKVGNEYLPYDPHAAHVDHDYRDGWNACYESAIAQPKQQARTLLEDYDLQQSPEYHKGREDGRTKGYEAGYRYATEKFAQPEQHTELPPLPEAWEHFQLNRGWKSWENVIPSSAGEPGVLAAFTADQMQAYARAAIAQPKQPATKLDPNKVQSCRVSPSGYANSQPCNCPVATCSLYRGGLVPPKQTAPVTDAMVKAYLVAQRAYVEEADRNWGRSPGGGLHTDTVNEACRAGITAALADPIAQPKQTAIQIAQSIEQASHNSVEEVERLRGSLRDSINRMNAGDTSRFSLETTLLAQCAAQNLAAQAGQSEPVAWLANYINKSGLHCVYTTSSKTLAIENDAKGEPQPLYTHPAPVRQPLTHTEITSLAYDCNALPEVVTDKTLIDFVRAIEATHGITTPESKP